MDEKATRMAGAEANAALVSIQIEHSSWWKWGDASLHRSLTEYPRFRLFMQEHFGQSFIDQIVSATTCATISNESNAELIAEVFARTLPELRLSTDRSMRLNKSIGKSYPDLLRVMHGKPLHLPDAVAFPSDHAQVQALLEVASTHGIHIVPFGGGTNVVGAFEKGQDQSPRLVVDLSAMDRLLDFDENNSYAVFQTGILGPALEQLLNEKGFTLGHFPQSFEYSSLGGWIATRSAGQESSYYGRIEDMVISLRIATPQGTLSTSTYEKDAEGINLKGLFFGSEGLLGIVTEARVRIYRLPEHQRWLTAVFGSFESGTEAVRQLVQAGVQPTVIRYSDEQETLVHAKLSHSPDTVGTRLKSRLAKWMMSRKGIGQPSLLLMRFDGDEAIVGLKAKRAARYLRRHGALLLGEGPGKKWETSRFGLPYLREDLMQRGILVDTMETVLPWNELTGLKDQLQARLQQTPAFGYEKGILLAHLSHVYRSSCSIYFTVLTLQSKEDPFGQWAELKSVVTEAIMEAGGAVSHHHSIGKDHQEWYLRKLDPLSLNLLRAIKQTLDPAHILNPGNSFDV